MTGSSPHGLPRKSGVQETGSRSTVYEGHIASACERAIGNNDPEDLERLTSVVSNTIHLIRDDHGNGPALIYAII
jgi:hypothetical protein